MDSALIILGLVLVAAAASGSDRAVVPVDIAERMAALRAYVNDPLRAQEDLDSFPTDVATLGTIT